MRTPLYTFHEAHGRVTEFAGFQLPLWYEGVIPETLAVRGHVGLFDVSHMGRIFITGKDAASFLDYVTTNAVSRLRPLQSHYTVMCNGRGGIIDDFVLTRLEERKFLMVANASNRSKDFSWMRSHLTSYHVSLEEVSDRMAMLAVQGPESRKLLQNLCGDDVLKIPRFGCGRLSIVGVPCIATGTGYTGEDGLEIFIPDSTVERPENALKVWNAILQQGRKFEIKPCGLGARDVLRLEAGMCLYGQDIDDSTTPLEARIGFVVKLKEKGEFIGRNSIEKQKSEGVTRIRVGLSVKGKGIPRSGCRITREGEEVGRVSSGTFSPTLKRGIAMGYVPPQYAQKGENLEIDIRGRSVEAGVVGFPFYDKARYGWQREG